jgi:hypothetical protein
MKINIKQYYLESFLKYILIGVIFLFINYYDISNINYTIQLIITLIYASLITIYLAAILLIYTIPEAVKINRRLNIDTTFDEMLEAITLCSIYFYTNCDIELIASCLVYYITSNMLLLTRNKND